MNKLQLNLETLHVESFLVADEEAEARGTVRGQEAAPSYLDVTICPTSCRCPNTQ